MALDYEQLGEIRELLNSLLDYLGEDIEEASSLAELERMYAKRKRIEATLEQVGSEMKQAAQ